MLKVKNVSKQYRGEDKLLFDAVSDVSLSMEDHCIYALVGESGCGKSTLSRLILGLESPSSGQILLDGKPISRKGKRNRKETAKAIQLVLQDGKSALDPHFTVYQAIAEPIRNLLDLSKDKEQARVYELLDRMGLPKETANKKTDVYKRQVLVGGIDIREMSLTDLTEKISYVSQDNFLFNMSLRDNIRIGKPEATDKEVEWAAAQAGCDEFISRFPQGYDTNAGDAGARLSGGERQRLAIARAILKNAPIVILDEATAFTDPENEDKLQRSIDKLTKGKTLIVIAHRLSTIMYADQILVLEDGQITAQGTHAVSYTHLSVTEELFLGISRTEEQLERARKLLKKLDLYAYKDAHPAILSGGQKQRLSIACGLLSGRELLLLDEPTSGLDGGNMRKIASALAEAAAEGKTILVITHDEELIEACCDFRWELKG